AVAALRCSIGKRRKSICHGKRHPCLSTVPKLAVLIAYYLSDYDAPLSEAGDYTTKYHLLRNLFSSYHNEPLPKLPSPLQRRAYQAVVVQQHLSLWDSLHSTEQ
ncbi:hypothetical protein GOODEAATRI_031261, partial [Goodea atripinnis]